MTVAAAAADPGRRSAPWPWSAVVVAVLAGAYFALGIRYTVGWESGWIDSGLVVYGSWRVADGALPYRDFDHVYGPAVFFWNGALLRAFGADLHVIRASLVVVKTLLAVGVHALATAAAGRTWAAVAATGFLVVVWGAPLWLFAEPYAQHYGVLLAVAGAAAFLAMPARPYVAALLAGLSFGCAAAFKLTCGVVGLSAVVLWILADSAPDQGSAAAPRRTSVRW